MYRTPAPNARERAAAGRSPSPVAATPVRTPPGRRNVNLRHPRREARSLLASVAGGGVGALADDAAPQADGDGAAAAPRIVFCDVTGRRSSLRQLAARGPGSRFVWRRSWLEDPGERRARAGRRSARRVPVGMWLWSGAEEELLARANHVLLRFVHPLVARGLPYCIGFPFAADVFARRPLGPADTTRLDLEDVGALLGVRSASREGDQPGVRRPARRRRGATAAAPAPDEVRLDAAQRAAVEHGSGPARVLAPAGSGKTKTLVSRVAALVARGVDPGGILLLAFNRKAAEQLEERLAAQGIATTRRIRGERGLRPAAVHCATFN